MSNDPVDGGTVTQPGQPDKVLLTFTLTEDEQPYCWPDTDDHGAEGYFTREGSKALYEEMEAHWNAAAALMRRLWAEVGLDPDSGQAVECCDQWIGDVTPAREYVTVGLRASGDPDVWPVIDIDHVTSFPTQEEADAFIASMPETPVLWPTHGELVEVDRSRFFTKAGGWPERVSACHRCNWERRDHPASETGDRA